MLPQFDAELGVNRGLIGSPSDDVLSGSGGDDFIYGGRGADTLQGGAGDDFLDGGKGVDRAIGGDGNDTITIGGGSFIGSYEHQNNNVLSGDIAAGGAGDDTLIVDFGGHGGNGYRILDGTVTGIETLSVLNHYSRWNQLFLTSEIFSTFTSIEIASQNYPWGETSRGYCLRKWR